MKKKKYIGLICLILIIQYGLNGQGQNKFKAGVAGGAIFSQIDGDLQQGYHRLGYTLGINGAYYVKPYLDISTELYLTSRGTRPNPRTTLFRKDEWQTTLSTQYAEARLVSNWHFSPHLDKLYYRQSLHVGLIFGRLLSSSLAIVRGYKADTLSTETIKSDLKNNDLGLTLGWSWHFSPRLSVMIQHGVSLIPIYKNDIISISKVTSEKKIFDRYVPYYFSVQMRYDFISPKVLTRAIKKKKKMKVRDNPLQQI